MASFAPCLPPPAVRTWRNCAPTSRRCLATFHDPVHLALVPRTQNGFAGWLYTRTKAVLQEVVSGSGSGMADIDTATVRRYLDARLPTTTSPAIPSLVKTDQDLRDFLADPAEFAITGMLDWERVTQGDGIFEITLIYLRLWLNRKLDGWANFWATYNRLATVRAEQCPQAEFYLMCRAVLAYRFNDGVAELIDQLLEGKASAIRERVNHAGAPRDGARVQNRRLAERQGFEPWVPARTHLISSQAHSAALAPLRGRRLSASANVKSTFRPPAWQARADATGRPRGRVRTLRRSPFRAVSRPAVRQRPLRRLSSAKAAWRCRTTDLARSYRSMMPHSFSQ